MRDDDRAGEARDGEACADGGRAAATVTDARRGAAARPRVSTYFRAELPVLALVTVTGVAYNGGLVLGPWLEGLLAQRLADVIQGVAAPSALVALAGAYVLAILCVQGMRFLKRLFVRQFANRVNRRMKGELYANLLSRSRADLLDVGAGAIMTKAISDVDDCAEGMRKVTTEIFDTGVVMVAYAVMLLGYDWRLAIVGMLFPPVTYVVAGRLRTLVTRASAQAKHSAERLGDAVLDRVGGALTYRVFGLEASRDAALEARLSDYERRETVANALGSAPQPLYAAMSLVGVVAVLALGARNVLGDGWASWDIAAFVTFTSCFTRLARKSSHAAKLVNAVQRARVSWDRISPYLGVARERPARPTLPPAPLLVHGMACGDGVLAGIDCALRPGQVIGVTGEVASGKSLFGLVLLGEAPYAGSVTFGGREVADLVRDDAWKVGYLGHDPELLAASVADNVLLGDGDDPWPALRLACLDREVAALPEAERTLVGDGGVRLSGGQQARLALARALHHGGSILVLDDPFSAVDKATETSIMAGLRDYARRTATGVVLISHRLAHFPELDGVLYLEGGGGTFATHDQLLASCPSYARLWRMQAAAAPAPAAGGAAPACASPAPAAPSPAGRASAAPAAPDPDAPGTSHARARVPGRGRHPLAPVLRALVRAHVPLVVALLLAIVLAVVVGLLPPLVMERLVNDLAARDGGEVLWLAWAYLGLVVLGGLAGAARETLIAAFGQKVTHAVRSAMAAKLSRLPASYYVDTPSGAVTSRFVNDVNAVEALFASGVLSLFADASSVVGVIAIVFTRSLGLGILLLVVVPLLFWFTRAVQRRMLAAQVANRVAVADANRQIPETVACARAVHAFRAEPFMRARYDEAIDRGFAAMQRSNFLDSIYSPVVMTVGAAVVGVMMALAAGGTGMRALFGMSVGTAVAVIAYVGRVFTPLASIGMEIQSIQQAVAGVLRIQEFLREPERPMPPADAPVAATSEDASTHGGAHGPTGALVSGLAPAVPALELRDVTFAYDDGVRVLEGLSVTVAQGERVTIVGRTGAGKSTLMKLMLGLYVPQAGTVRVLGRDPALVPARDRRHLFGYVEQQFRPVPGSIADQVSLGDPRVAPDDVARALATVGLAGAVGALPRGADTPCEACGLSQGQLQLLSIARAVVCDPRVLLLDEITANLDSSTERRVMDAIASAARGRTVIAISHRAAGVVGGRVVRIGG